MNRSAGRDRGFTLIELIMATAMSGIIAGVIIAALATSLNVARSTSDQIADSTDTALISAFLFRDAQAAGGTDPTTATVDTSVGVSTSNTSSGWAGCPQPGQLVVRFSWVDRATDATDRTLVVTYALADGQLTRRACEDGTGVDVVLANNIATAVAACAPDPSCGGLAEEVSLTFSATDAPTPYEHTLTASLRAGTPRVPDAEGSPLVPLVVLGGPAATTPCPVVTVGDQAAVAVVGDAAIAAECGGQPVQSAPGSIVHPRGTMRTLTGLSDPFTRLEPPAAACGEDGTPAAGPDPAIVHTELVLVDDATELEPGNHVFCAGLDVRGGATLTGDAVFLFFLGGTLSVHPEATVDLTAQESGPYQNLLAWVATSQPVSIGGDAIGRYAGYIYAPTSDLVVAGAAPTSIGGAVARSVEFIGTARVRLGLAVPHVTIGAPTIPNGQVGLAYPDTAFAADGGQPPYTWSATGLPPGLTLDPTTGVLAGAPTEPGPFEATITVLDSTWAAATVHVEIAISAALSIEGPASLPDGQVAIAYPATAIAATGGTSPFAWAITDPPAGLALDPATGVLSGTPTTAGSFPITVTVTDAGSATVSRTYTVAVREQLVVATPALPGGQVGAPYPTVALTATGGAPPTTWSASGVPPGLTVDPGGSVTGTPSTPGTYNVVVQATDAMSATATIVYAVTIAPELGVGTTVLPGGQVGVPYPPTEVVATGGTPPFVWSARGLPDGLAIDATTGVVSGNPAAPGTFQPAIEITDATGAASSAEYSIVIDAALTIAGPATLPPGQVGLAYPSTAVTPAGGTGPYTWSATGLPAGLAIDAATGVISGHPTAPGTFTVDVWAADALSVAVSRRYELTVAAQLAIATAELPNGTVDIVYPTTTLTATGGTPPLTWSASGLPAGLEVSPATGVLTGTPAATGDWTVAIGVRDAAGATATRTYSLSIAAPASACPVAPVGWRAEYYANISLAGDPKICRDDAAVDFDWGSAAPPGTGLAADNFSVRWTRTQTFAAGTYTFVIGSDDGSRLYIDGVLVFDRWVDQPYPTPVPTLVRALTAGDHTIVMEYYERGGDSKATLSWTAAAPSNPCPATIDGWKGEYFANATLTAPVTVCRSDASVDFNWGAGSPASGIPADRFSARWTRVVDFTAGTYTFSLGSDDGSRLYVDGVLVLDRWSDRSFPNPVPTVDRVLAAGSHTIVVEYYENGGNARVELEWTRESNGITATPSVGGDHRWYGEHQITLKNTSPITAMTVTIVVDRTLGQSYAGMWTDFPGNALKLSQSSKGGLITYTFDLRSNVTVPPGEWVLVAQTSGSGFLHPTAGDTWRVVTTSDGATTTLTGTF